MRSPCWPRSPRRRSLGRSRWSWSTRTSAGPRHGRQARPAGAGPPQVAAGPPPRSAAMRSCAISSRAGLSPTSSRFGAPRTSVSRRRWGCARRRPAHCRPRAPGMGRRARRACRTCRQPGLHRCFAVDRRPTAGDRPPPGRAPAPRRPGRPGAQPVVGADPRLGDTTGRRQTADVRRRWTCAEKRSPAGTSQSSAAV